MKTDNGLAIAFFVAVIGGAVTLAIANDIAAPLCDAAKIKSMAPDKIEFGCFEFWLNRYQTTLQTIVSCAIGAAGLYFVLRQLVALGQQNEMTRAALEATLRAQKLAENAAKAKAAVAIESYAAGTAMLVRMAKQMLARQRVEMRYFEHWEAMRDRQSEISAGMIDPDSARGWAYVREEFDILIGYFTAVYRGEDVHSGPSFIYPRATPPKSHEEAAERLVQLQYAVIKLRNTLLS